MARYPKRLTVMKTSLKKPTPERGRGGGCRCGAAEEVPDAGRLETALGQEALNQLVFDNAVHLYKIPVTLPQERART
jgi:hypothetical protein